MVAERKVGIEELEAVRKKSTSSFPLLAVSCSSVTSGEGGLLLMIRGS